MLMTLLNTFLASIFISINSAAPQLRVLTFETTDTEICIRNNHNYISQVCTYPGQTDPCLFESFGVNGKYFWTTFSNNLIISGTIKHVYKIEQLAEFLCNQQIDAKQIYEQYCCHDKTCLFWCYGNKSNESRNRSHVRSYKQLEYIF